MKKTRPCLHPLVTPNQLPKNSIIQHHRQPYLTDD